MDEETRISRRDSLLKLGGLLAGAAAVGGWKVADSLGAEDIAGGTVACVLAPESTEGPFYLDDHKIRRNITEGKPGVALMLHLRVVDASTCRAIRGATVDIWHCDAGGVYSGTDAQDTEDKRFLRGIQRTDAKGLAVFRTIYPGWYGGRAVHVHVAVHVGGKTVHTGQLYFPDPLTDTVYKRAPYARRPNRDTRNAADFIYPNGGKRSTLKLSKSGPGYVGSIVMGVRRS